MFKKYTSAILALVMIMALALPGVYALSSSNYAVSSGTTGMGTAGASTTLASGKDNQEIKPSVLLAVPALDITFQGNGAVILNPYKLNITLAAGTVNTAAVTGGGQGATTTYSSDSVVGVPIVIESKTGVPVRVSVKPKATKASGATFELTATEVAKTETSKKIQMWIEGKDAGTGGTDPGSWTAKYTATAKNMAIFSEDGGDYKAIHIIDAWQGGNSAAVKGFYKVNGSMTEKPTDPWGTKDTITASITFKFEQVSSSTTL